MKTVIIFSNPGGELDRRELEGEAELNAAKTAAAVIEMIQQTGFLYDGDTITITEVQ